MTMTSAMTRRVGSEGGGVLCRAVEFGGWRRVGH